MRFSNAVDLLDDCKGKVVVSGMGKSGLIGQKIAATLASTGTPSFFLHPAEGVHGDLGMLARRDASIAISNSGETQELLQLLPFVERMGIPVVALDRRIGLDAGQEQRRRVGCVRGGRGLSHGAWRRRRARPPRLRMGDALAVALLAETGVQRG